MSQVSAKSELFAATAVNPFGLPLDPHEVKGTVLSTKYNVVLGTSYLLSDHIFAYQLPTAAEDEFLLSLWSKLHRQNLAKRVPSVRQLDILPDSGNLLLGYLKNSSNSATVVASTDALATIAPALAQHSNNEYHSLPLSIQLSTVSYDFTNNAIVSNFEDAFTAAKNLKLPILVSSSAVEAQLFTVISIVLSTLNIANIHIFNGPEAINTNKTLTGLYSSDELNSFSEKLFNALHEEALTLKNRSDLINHTFSKVNAILGTSLSTFQNYGNVNSETVYTLYPESEALVAAVASIDNSAKFGAVVVKSHVPFDSENFIKVIGTHVKEIEVVSPSLKLEIQASLFFKGKFNVQVKEESPKVFIEKINPQNSTSFKFLLNDNSKFVELPAKLAHALSLIEGSKIQFTPVYDNTINAGLLQADISVGESFNYTNKFDFILIEDISILNSVDVSAFITEKTNLVVLNDAETVFDAEKIIEKKLSIRSKKFLASAKIDVKVIDLNAVAEVDETKGRTHAIAIQSIFWLLNFPDWDKHAVVTKILQFFGSEAELLASVIADQVENSKAVALKEIKHDAEWLKIEELEEPEEAYSVIHQTSFKPNPREAFIDNVNVITENKAELTKKLLFKEAYGTTTELRPDQPVKNFVVKVKENRRLTPSDYDRNIFHIEFDTTGTGLVYNIGEALGIHGRNNPELVEEFIKMYGVDGNELVEVASKENNQILEVRTLRQSLIENLDLFGKPPKRFYEALVDFAENEEEKKELEKLISPAGAALFKKFQDEEFYTFADIFELFKSVRPSAEDLVQIISPLKRREYSIASSQKLHPNEIHLLIVVVDWVDNKGRKRFGQCSKYLSDLQVGQELVVSVKPSIMKLPPLTKQPIIMAGLGTGLAPFKAFIEERQYQLEHGAEIGEIYLYLGSRHKRQEYLYGEYWESYMSEGVLTHLGAAFSRDQVEKIYIQDRIRENLTEIKDLIINKGGHFYLCGPTWPVPDISACLQDVFDEDARDKGIKVDSAKLVEEMKEDGKYVLEVY
ncbi:hypothetical protein CANINC_004170 [Pichia inconspicua]|uniref:assimilatory sulfite reductase (NADPH) n=1 Tax=Pichia inconspicua TaxID=52247 RepID=A0A4T0WYE9_9ASCO|nr:hypothetical protein CANINC_004170 [[Candida] inconspicua]